MNFRSITKQLGKATLCGSLLLSLLCATPAKTHENHFSPSQKSLSLISLEGIKLESYVESYADIVYRNYLDTRLQAVKLQAAIDAFVKNPNLATQQTAKNAWIQARKSYLQTEAFRFYEGPIDYIDPNTGEEGPEGRINAWPMNEAFIDYVRENPNSGIINNQKLKISIKTILENDQVTDEADVTTGWHAIEFLLWGQDFNAEGPGQRTYQDFMADIANNNRRREYLEIVTKQLVKDLTFLENQWQPNANNYRASFIKKNPQENMGKIFTALATLSAFEMSSERMAVALDSGDQEDEHSCFSDTTHLDYIYNQRGIRNVYFGEYGDFKGQGFNELMARVNPELNQKIIAKLNKTERNIGMIHEPFDRVLASQKGSQLRQQVELAIESLEAQAKLFQELGETLGAKVEILAE
ncbi:MAG: iron-regulated protein [Moorea sp. SIO2B7]|nr:iron-regulated protein [Moorena sp. SIO2B7]